MPEVQFKVRPHLRPECVARRVSLPARSACLGGSESPFLTRGGRGGRAAPCAMHLCFSLRSRCARVQLVLLGDMNVGKTSMALRFVKNQFFEYQDNTIGGESPQPSQPPAAVAAIPIALCHTPSYCPPSPLHLASCRTARAPARRTRCRRRHAHALANVGAALASWH